MFKKTIVASSISLILAVLLMGGTAGQEKVETKDRKSSLPASTNGELQRLWKKVKKYEHTQCYQNYQGKAVKMKDGTVDIPEGYVSHINWRPGIDRINPEGNKRSNTHEFPWVKTAGFEGTAEHYVHIPEDQHIEYTDTLGRWPDHGDSERVWEWRFPAGTVFVETLDTRGRIFEVRTRTKAGDGTWRSNVYRPYADAKDLQTKLRRLGTRDAKRLANSIDTLPSTYLKIKNPHDVTTFEFKGNREDLPDIPESLAETILSWEFEANAEWKTDCFAPSTKSDSLSIVPKDYLGCIVRPDSKGCMQCHDSTLKHTFTLERNRDWYGRVRGSDGIFSFHIFANKGISLEGTSNPLPVFLNTDLPIKKVGKFSAAYHSPTDDVKP